MCFRADFGELGGTLAGPCVAGGLHNLICFLPPPCRFTLKVVDANTQITVRSPSTSVRSTIMPTGTGETSTGRALGHISRCGDALTRSYLYEAANIMLSRPRNTNPHKNRGVKLAKRAGFKKARVASS